MFPNYLSFKWTSCKHSNAFSTHRYSQMSQCLINQYSNFTINGKPVDEVAGQRYGIFTLVIKVPIYICILYDLINYAWMVTCSQLWKRCFCNFCDFLGGKHCWQRRGQDGLRNMAFKASFRANSSWPLIVPSSTFLGWNNLKNEFLYLWRFLMPKGGV